MLITYKYRLYPTLPQQELLSCHFGCVRFIYNVCLELKSWLHTAYDKNISRFELQGQVKDLKTDCPWLREVNSQSLQAAILHLDRAFTHFFEKRAGYPRYKKRSCRQSFHCPQSVSVTQGKLHIPKFREGISMVEHRALTGTIRNATVSKTAGGKYYVSIVALTEEKLKEPLPFRPETTTGIDLGIKSFAVLSDGSQYDSPKPLKQSLAKLKVLQRRLAKKRKGSSNRKKAAGRVALLHEHIANQRKDFLHKLSNVITKRYDTLCVEDLAIMNMTKNHQLAGSISDAGWGMFLTFVKYKSAWRGKRVVEIGRFEPSSKRHYGCGKKYEGLTLGDREWTCPHCGERVLRDVNAALNIRAFGILKITGVECTVEPVELPALAGAMKQEKFAGRRLCLILSMPPSQKEVVHCPGITFP